MRPHILWLVAGTTSAIVLAFVIPLALLVRSVAEDRAVTAANDEARAIAALVATVPARPDLVTLVDQAASRSVAATIVLLPDGTVLGAVDPGLAEDPGVTQARQGAASTDLDGDGARVYVPVVTTAGTSVVVATLTEAQLRDGVLGAWVGLAGLGLLLLGVALAIADRISRRISEPVTSLAEVAERLQSGDLTARAEPHGPVETVELADTINRLADRIDELLLAERQAVGDLSHRLRTPITALRLDADGVTDGEVAARLMQHIETLQQSIDAIVRDARRPLHASLASTCDAVAVVRARAAFWSALAEDVERPVTITLDDGPLLVALAAQDLTDLVDVLVDNVFAHTPDDVAFTIRLAGQDDQVIFEVVDEGGRRLATAPEDAVGSTGLGLQIARRTSARVGGHLTLKTTDDRTWVRVVLPRERPPAEH